VRPGTDKISGAISYQGLSESEHLICLISLQGTSYIWWERLVIKEIK